jgi:hemoglobin/transferrin/lactoferrin receptor protein
MHLLRLLPLLPLAVHGQDLLNPLITTAARLESAELDTAYTVERIDESFIEQNTRRTLPEALQFTPGVLVQKTAHGHGSPFIRGLTGRQNLLLVDGVRINKSTWRGGPVQYWNTIDPFSIDHLELVKSQGSVLFGSDAAGGTLNAFTKSSGFAAIEDGRFFNHGSAYYEYRSNGDGSHVGRIENAFGVGGQYGVFLGVSAKDFGDLRDSAVGLMRNTGYPEQDLDFRFDLALNPQTTLTLLHQQVNQDAVPRWHSTVFNPGWQHSGHVAAPGTWLARTLDQERSLSYLRIDRENADDAFVKRWSATLSYQTGRDSEAQFRSATDRRYQIAEVDTLGFDLSFESPLGDGDLIYGLDYYQDSVESEGYRKRGAGALLADPTNRPLADDASYDLFGAFSQYVWKPSDAFELTAGARYTYAAAELGRYYDATARADAFDAESSWDNVVGSLRGLYRLAGGWSLYGGASQAFRAPNLDDLSGNVTSRSGLAAKGSSSVNPEEYLTYELGTRHSGERTSLNLAVFYTDVDNLISAVPTTPGGNTTVATNGRGGYLYGVELEGAWRFHPDWTASGFVAWQDGRNENSAFIGGPIIDEPGSRLLPLTGSLALRWTEPSEKFWVEGRVLAAAEANRLSTSDRADTQRIPVGGTPDYAVWMLHGGWRATEHLELTAGLENLTDEDYRNHGSGQNEPGFNAILGAKLIW